MRLHRELESAASVWEENGRDPAFLYRGSRLAAVQESLNETNSPVPPSVRSFLDSSRSHERRRARKLHGLRSLVGLLAVVVLLSGGIAFQQNREALKLATAGAFATNSRLLAIEHPDVAMALAVGAFRLIAGPVTRSALLSAQSQYFAGQLVGHTNTINKVVFSPDGHLLAIAGTDGTAQLWDGAIRSVAFHPDTSAAGRAESTGVVVAGRNPRRTAGLRVRNGEGQLPTVGEPVQGIGQVIGRRAAAVTPLARQVRHPALVGSSQRDPHRYPDIPYPVTHRIPQPVQTSAVQLPRSLCLSTAVNGPGKH